MQKYEEKKGLTESEVEDVIYYLTNQAEIYEGSYGKKSKTAKAYRDAIAFIKTKIEMKPILVYGRKPIKV